MRTAIDRFLQYLRVERNASAYTTKSYREDLAALADYLSEARDGQCPEPGDIAVLELRGYVAALENPAASASFEWRGPNRAAIRARLEPGQVIATQVTYDPGWRASVNGATRAVYRDGIGFMAVRAQCAGECEIELDYDGGIEAKLCRAASLGALLLSAAFGLGLPRRMRESLRR